MKFEALSESKSNGQGEGERMLRDEGVADDIANVVAIWTGIPPTKLLESDRSRILNMADNLNNRGQDLSSSSVRLAWERLSFARL